MAKYRQQGTDTYEEQKAAAPPTAFDFDQLSNEAKARQFLNPDGSLDWDHIYRAGLSIDLIEKVREWRRSEEGQEAAEQWRQKQYTDQLEQDLRAPLSDIEYGQLDPDDPRAYLRDSAQADVYANQADLQAQKDALVSMANAKGWMGTSARRMQDIADTSMRDVAKRTGRLADTDLAGVAEDMEGTERGLGGDIARMQAAARGMGYYKGQIDELARDDLARLEGQLGGLDPRLAGVSDKLGGLADQFGDVYAQEGMTEADKSAMELARMRAAQNLQQQQAATASRMAARGVGGSGLAMAQERMNAQDMANMVAQQNMESQIAARQRALESLGLRGETLGQQAGVEGQRGDIMGLRRDVHGLRGDLFGRGADIGGAQADIYRSGADVRGMQGDLQAQRAGIHGMRGDLYGQMSDIHGARSGIHGDVAGIYGQQSALSADQAAAYGQRADTAFNQAMQRAAAQDQQNLYNTEAYRQGQMYNVQAGDKTQESLREKEQMERQSAQNVYQAKTGQTQTGLDITQRERDEPDEPSTWEKVKSFIP